jgi:hypothetical protein
LWLENNIVATQKVLLQQSAGLFRHLDVYLNKAVKKPQYASMLLKVIAAKVVPEIAIRPSQDQQLRFQTSAVITINPIVIKPIIIAITNIHQ